MSERLNTSQEPGFDSSLEPRIEITGPEKSKAKKPVFVKAAEALTEKNISKVVSHKKPKNDEQISRRGFFGQLFRKGTKAAAVAGVGAVGVGVGQEVIKSSLPEEIDENAPNITIVDSDKTKARWRVAQSIHTVENDEKILYDSRFKKFSDALILEMPIPAKNPSAVYDHSAGNPEFLQYHKLFSQAYEKEIPIFFVDIVEDDVHKSYENTIKELNEKKIIALIQLMFGVGLAVVSGITYVGGRATDKISRRRFLKVGAGALLATATYLVTPGFEEVMAQKAYSGSTKEPDERSFARQSQRVLRKINKTHPERELTETLKKRNILMAQNSNTVAKLREEELGGVKPIIPMVLGADHFEIEDYLKDPENEKERLRYLRDNMGDENFKKQGLIVRVDPYKEDGKQMVKISYIKNPSFDIK